MEPTRPEHDADSKGPTPKGKLFMLGKEPNAEGMPLNAATADHVFYCDPTVTKKDIAQKAAAQRVQ